jgi:hypothetical protein
MRVDFFGARVEVRAHVQGRLRGLGKGTARSQPNLTIDATEASYTTAKVLTPDRVGGGIDPLIDIAGLVPIRLRTDRRPVTR